MNSSYIIGIAGEKICKGRCNHSFKKCSSDDITGGFLFICPNTFDPDMCNSYSIFKFGYDPATVASKEQIKDWIHLTKDKDRKKFLNYCLKNYEKFIEKLKDTALRNLGASKDEEARTGLKKLLKSLL